MKKQIKFIYGALIVTIIGGGLVFLLENQINKVEEFDLVVSQIENKVNLFRINEKTKNSDYLRILQGANLNIENFKKEFIKDGQYSNYITKGDFTNDSIDDIIFYPEIQNMDLDIPIILLEGKGNDEYSILLANINTGINLTELGMRGSIKFDIFEGDKFKVTVYYGSVSGGSVSNIFLKTNDNYKEIGSSIKEFDWGDAGDESTYQENQIENPASGELFTEYNFDPY